MIKVIVAQNNDIFYNSLSNIALKNETKIELINVSLDQICSLVYRMKRKENLIILDAATSVSFCINILKNMSNRLDKADIIILVVDSKQITNIVNHERYNHHFMKKTNTFSIIEAINIVSDSIKDTMELESKVIDILWRLGFPSYLKATIYLRDAILLACNNKELIQDTTSLIREIARKNNILNEKSIRSDIDKSINNILDYTKDNVIYKVFGDDYDGRKVSFKYFIDLCIRYLNKKDIAV